MAAGATLLTPWGYAIMLGNTSAQILPSNPSRKGLIFSNPSNVNVAVCPALTSNNQPLAAVVSGAGSFTLFQGAILVLPQAGWPDNIGIGSAFNGIATAPNTPFTIWEF